MNWQSTRRHELFERVSKSQQPSFTERRPNKADGNGQRRIGSKSRGDDEVRPTRSVRKMGGAPATRSGGSRRTLGLLDERRRSRASRYDKGVQFHVLQVPLQTVSHDLPAFVQRANVRHILGRSCFQLLLVRLQTIGIRHPALWSFFGYLFRQFNDIGVGFGQTIRKILEVGGNLLWKFRVAYAAIQTSGQAR